MTDGMASPVSTTSGLLFLIFIATVCEIDNLKGKKPPS